MGRLVPNGLPTGSKAEMRRWIDLTNEVQHGGTREVSVECAEEKNSVDRLDPVSQFILSPRLFHPGDKINYPGVNISLE